MEDKMPEPKDQFKDLMAIMVAVVVLVTAVAAWRASNAARAAGFEDYSALTATLNAEEARALNTARAYAHYAAFTNYAVNDQLLSLLEEDQANATTEDERLLLDFQIAEADKLAKTNQRFFPARFVSNQGGYNLQRELSEEWADAERSQDFNTERHLDRSNRQDAKTFSFVSMVILLGIALLYYTCAGALHPERRWLRWGAALSGTLSLLVSLAAIVMTEFG
jgi:hypothetical protein